MNKTTLLLSIIMALLLLCIYGTQAAVIGIDMGTEFIKVGIVKPGSPIDLVLNEQSKRKTTAFVGYRGKERMFGYNALQMNSRMPKGIAKYLKMVFGHVYNEESMVYDRYKNQLLIPYKMEKNIEKGTMDIVLTDKQTKKDFTYPVESLLGQLLEHVKGFAEKDAKMTITDCIITVPTFYTMEQRAAVAQIAEIAGLNVITMLHDTAALALQYGITKYTKVKTDSHHVLFFDMGSATTKVSIAEFTPKQKSKNIQHQLGTIKMKAHSWDTQLGGLDYTVRIANHIADTFQKEHKIDLRQHERAWARVMETANKAKEVLTANTEHIVWMESIVNDINYRVKITRDEFDEMCADLTERIAEPIMAAMKKAKINAFKHIESFEIVGGAARVVAVQEKLKQIFKHKLSHSLNGDEAIALGASFYAAALSTRFRVRSFDLNDIFPYQVKFVLSAADPSKEPKEYTLFKAGDDMDNSKSVNIPRNADFSVDVVYGDEIPTGFKPTIASYAIEKVSETIDTNFGDTLKDPSQDPKAKVRLTFTLSSSGIVDLSSSQATLEYTSMVPQKNETNTEKEGEETEEQLVKKTLYKKADVVAKKTFGECKPLSSSTIQFIKNQLFTMRKYEEEQLALSEARNTLESYIYQTQYTMLEEEEYQPYYTESEKEALIAKLTAADEWMYENEYNEKLTKIDYLDRLAEMKLLSEPIVERKTAHAARQDAITESRDQFKVVTNLVKLMRDKYKHITDEELDTIVEQVNTTRTWIKEQAAAQEKLSLAEPAKLTAEMIHEKVNAVLMASRTLMAKPQPKVIPEKVKTNTTANATDEATPPPKQDDEATPEPTSEQKAEDL